MTKYVMTEAHKEKIRAANRARTAKTNVVVAKNTKGPVLKSNGGFKFQQPNADVIAPAVNIGAMDDLLSAALSGQDDNLEDADKLEVEVKESASETPKPKNAVEAILGKLNIKSKPVQKRTSKSKVSDDSFLIAIIPTISIFISSFSTGMVQDEYKPCAPTQQDVNAMLMPLARMVTRKFEITGELSEDAKDMSAFIMAVLAYGASSYVTFLTIKRDKDTEKDNAGSDRARRASNQGSADGHSGADREAVAASSLASTQLHGERGNEDSQSKVKSTGPSPSSVIDRAFHQDYVYRQQLGLL